MLFALHSGGNPSLKGGMAHGYYLCPASSRLKGRDALAKLASL